MIQDLMNFENLRKTQSKNFKIFPSLRFNYFISLLKNAKYIVGNSSCAIYEAPYFKIQVSTLEQDKKKDFYQELYSIYR